MKTLILGGVRSGKSKLAESIALASRFPITYIATATSSDDEMRARIDAHRRRRPSGWSVVEEPIALAAALKQGGGNDKCVLIECLTLWLTNLLVAEDEALLEREQHRFVDQLTSITGDVICVGNETNLGIVPTNAMARQYCDIAGALHQRLASECDRVIFMVAGIPLVVKGPPL